MQTVAAVAAVATVAMTATTAASIAILPIRVIQCSQTMLTSIWMPSGIFVTPCNIGNIDDIAPYSIFAPDRFSSDVHRSAFGFGKPILFRAVSGN